MARADSSLPASLADMAALGKLWQEHAPKLLAMVRRRMDPALAVRIDPDEVMSEAFVEARRRWQRFRKQSQLTPYAWLYRIVLDSLIETWRKQTRGCRDLRRDLPLPEASCFIASGGQGSRDGPMRIKICEAMTETELWSKDVRFPQLDDGRPA